MNKSVKETATDLRDSLSEYFAFHILPSNSPEIRTNAISPRPCVVYKAKRSIYKKYFLKTTVRVNVYLEFAKLAIFARNSCICTT